MTPGWGEGGRQLVAGRQPVEGGPASEETLDAIIDEAVTADARLAQAQGEK